MIRLPDRARRARTALATLAVGATALCPAVAMAAPSTPAITAAPGPLTNVAAPTFTWTGDATTYRWAITDPTGAAVASGRGPETTATPPSRLGEGAHTFTVVGVEEPDPLLPEPPAESPAAESPPASVGFTVDTVAPPAPRITVRPSFPTSVTTPLFGVDGVEPGAAAAWSVVAAGGVTAQGPAPLTGSSVTLATLGAGSYLFQVVQTDAAGNVSPVASEPFAIVATLTPTTAKPTVARTKLVLPRMNVRRLSPRAGASIPTVSPVLTWKRGPRGTTVYNVQVFRVGRGGARETAAVRLTKLRSVFPRARQVRMKGLKRGQCYVWRVWPFIGARYTAKPLGVSNFCVAKRPAPRGRAGR